MLAPSRASAMQLASPIPEAAVTSATFPSIRGGSSCHPEGAAGRKTNTAVPQHHSPNKRRVNHSRQSDPPQS